MSEKLKFVKKVEWKYDKECLGYALLYSLIANIVSVFGMSVFLEWEFPKDILILSFVFQAAMLACIVLLLIIGFSREVYYEEVKHVREKIV
jgi:hypothetical protein